jgi:hypothetical protein
MACSGSLVAFGTFGNLCLECFQFLASRKKVKLRARDSEESGILPGCLPISECRRKVVLPGDTGTACFAE